jgi:hypothetical protein
VQNRFLAVNSSASNAAAAAVSQVVYSPVPSTALKAAGIDAVLTITAAQDARFLCIAAGSTIETKASRCVSGWAFLKKLLQLCDGRPGSYIFGVPTRFLITPRWAACIARGAEAGSYDAFVVAFKDDRAHFFFLDEMRTSTLSRDELTLTKADLVATIHPLDGNAPNAMTSLLLVWSLYVESLHVALADQYAAEYAQVFAGINALHESEDIPKVEFTAENCSFIASAVLKDGNACIDAFLEGADHLHERWPDIEMINVGTAGMRPKLWLNRRLSSGEVVFSSFYTSAFVVHAEQKRKPAFANAATENELLRSTLATLTGRLTALEAAPQGAQKQRNAPGPAPPKRWPG